MSASEKSGGVVPTTTRFISVRRGSTVGGGVTAGVGELDKGLDKSETVAFDCSQLHSNKQDKDKQTIVVIFRNFMGGSKLNFSDRYTFMGNFVRDNMPSGCAQNLLDFGFASGFTIKGHATTTTGPTNLRGLSAVLFGLHDQGVNKLGRNAGD